MTLKRMSMYIVANSEEEKKKKMNISSKNSSWLMGAVSRKAVSVNMLEIWKTSCGQS